MSKTKAFLNSIFSMLGRAMNLEKDTGRNKLHAAIILMAANDKTTLHFAMLMFSLLCFIADLRVLEYYETYCTVQERAINEIVP